MIRRIFTLGLLAALVGGLVSGCQSPEPPGKPYDLSGLQMYIPSFTDPESRELAAWSRRVIKDKGTDYRLGPGDLIEVSIFEWELREETKTAGYRVGQSGVISLPVVGELKVAGQTVQQVQAMVENRLTEGGILRQPRVSVDIREFRSKIVNVTGQVYDPGVYTLRENSSSLVELLSLAGGTTPNAGNVAYVMLSPQTPQMPRAVVGDEPPETLMTVPDDPAAITELLARPIVYPPRSGVTIPGADSQRVLAIDLYELLEVGNEQLDVGLQSGATIYVPSRESYSVLGFVKAPGNYSLTRPTTLLDALAEAGGIIEQDASPEWTVLRRRSPQGVVLLPVDLKAVRAGDVPNFFLVPGDVVVVPQTDNKRVRNQILDGVQRIFNVGLSIN